MTRRSKVTGFVTEPILGYVAAGAILAVTAAGGLAWLQTSRLDALRKEYAEFKGGVEALGRAAQQAAADKEKFDKLRKEAADAQNAAALATLTRTIDELRRNRDRARGSIVPEAPRASNRPDLACFDRPLLESALRDYRSRIRGLVDEGTAGAVNLDTAKSWAQQR